MINQGEKITMKTNTLNIKPYNNKEQLLFPASVGDYLPKGHLAHTVDEAVDEIDLGPLYKKISPVGNPPYHPALMAKIWFYGYATNTYSSRKIEDKLNTDVAFIYLAGMQKPDFRTISDYRKNNAKELKELFVQIVQICHRLGMTKLGEISLDSKVMKANASADRTYNEKKLVKEQKIIEKAIKGYLERATQTDTKEDELYGHNKRGNELPENICAKKERIKKMKQEIHKLKQAYEKLEKSDKDKINTTDEDAQFQRDKSRIIPGYRGQAAVDSKEQVIIANDVTSENTDTSQLIPMIDQIIENVKELKENKQEDNEEENIKLVADSNYSSGPNLAELEKEERKHIEPYIPDDKYTAKERGHTTDEDSPFHASKFLYDKEQNCLICPEGKRANFINEIKHRGKPYLFYKFRDCKNCKNFGKCTTDKDGRNVGISKYIHLIYKMREKLSTEEAKQIYAIRKITSEPVFGNMSHNLKFRAFSLRTLRKVKGEFSLMCTAHNLIKIRRFITNSGKSLKEMLNVAASQPLLNTS